MIKHRWVWERVLFGLAVLALFGELWSILGSRVTAIAYGSDLRIYLEATARYLNGGPFYHAHQLSGPYEVRVGDVLYPPVSVLLFAPFLVLPTILWWAVPAAAIGAVIWRHRPTIVGWTGIVIALALPYTVPLVVAGNPSMWVAVAVACGTLYGWPSVFVLLKPSLFPFALIGVGWRAWWIALAAFAAVSVLFLPAWLDYLTVMRNTRSEPGVLYSLGDVALVGVPIIAWVTRQDRRTIGPLRARTAPP
jgi:hypothetical protein